jgi:hypothetical protein
MVEHRLSCFAAEGGPVGMRSASDRYKEKTIAEARAAVLTAYDVRASENALLGRPDLSSRDRNGVGMKGRVYAASFDRDQKSWILGGIAHR